MSQPVTQHQLGKVAARSFGTQLALAGWVGWYHVGHTFSAVVWTVAILLLWGSIMMKETPEL